METIATLPAVEDGLFTTAQARALGLSRRALQDLVRRRHIDHVCRGVYGPHEPDLSPEERHLRLLRAGYLLYPDAVASHVSAVVAHGMPVVDHSLERVCLLRSVEKEILTASFRIRPLEGEGVDTASGPAVPAAMSVVQLALDGGVMPGVVAGDHGLRERLFDVSDLEAAAAAVHGWPRSGRVQAMLPLLDMRSESPGESRLRVHLQVAGISVVPQVAISDEDGEFVARVDFVVQGTKVVVEFDGKVKYRDGDVDTLFREKRREDRLRRLGYTVIRVTWSDLARPERIVAWIRQATSAA
jgi:very-short-patch-repair endonuclease